jgi:hypothetical protein
MSNTITPAPPKLSNGISIASGESLSLTGAKIGGGGALRNIGDNNGLAGNIDLQNVVGIHRINSDSGLLTLSGQFFIGAMILSDPVVEVPAPRLSRRSHRCQRDPRGVDE